MSAWDLVAAAQNGDTDAFGELWKTYQPPVYRFVLGRVRDPHLAEDLTSDTFLKAWRSIGSVHDQGRDIGGWLLTIARNTITDHFKSPARTVVILPRTPVDANHAGAGLSDGPDVIVPEQYARADATARLGQYVAGLSGRQQEALRLRYVEELPGAASAELLGCREADARNVATRARKTLRGRLVADGYNGSADFMMPTPRGAA